MLFVGAKDDRLAGTIDVADCSIGVQHVCMRKQRKDPGPLTLRGSRKDGRKIAYGTSRKSDDASCEV